MQQRLRLLAALWRAAGAEIRALEALRRPALWLPCLHARLSRTNAPVQGGMPQRSSMVYVAPH